MARTVPVIAVLIALLAPASPAHAERPVKRHDRGATVKKLQRLLGIRADGAFGKGTARALKRFQRRHSLNADGVAGPATWRMLKKVHRLHHRSGGGGSGGRARVQRRGSSVRLAQRHLGVTADGVYGPGTARAVKRFQRRHGLTADGVVGPATWRALGIRGRHPVLKRAKLHGGGGRRGGSTLPVRVRRAIRAANRIAFAPYRYGGGHGSFSDSGYDCSGTVSYVLHGMGMLPSPLDSSALMSYGAPGPGRYITIYANPGHTYMTILHRRFDTSMRGAGGSRWNSQMRSTAGYTVRHPPGL